MKNKYTIILALLFISSATYAQNTLNSQANALRQDSVGKEVINFIEPGCSGLVAEYVGQNESTNRYFVYFCK